MRNGVSFLAILAAGCATPGGPYGNDAGELEVAIARGNAAFGPSLAVIVTNRSGHPVCLTEETFRNPGTYEMRVELRDGRNRYVPLTKAGFIPPPYPGIVRLEPGASARGEYGVSGRYRNIDRRPIGRGWAARANFRYGDCQDRPALCGDTWKGPCIDRWSQPVRTPWQRI